MDIDERYMRRAIQLAKLGAGWVSPNPMVGAVIVREGKIIGEGYHHCYGKAHAEVNAVASVFDKNLLHDATIYVTLEPCSHYGKTPPCSELIIKSGIPRIVVGMTDPFAKVHGRGITMLREAGVEVVTGVLEADCRALNKHFVTAHTLHRPYVLLKWAQSRDGFIDKTRTNGGEPPVKFSTSLTTVLMHRERSHVDAIMVGARTVAFDDPSLTVRLCECRVNPLRVVLDGRLSMPAESKLLTDGLPTVVYSRYRNCIVGNVEYVKLEHDGLLDILEDLYVRKGVTSLMVEGGASLLSQFVSAGLWDEARIETAPFNLECGVVAPKLNGIIENLQFHGGNRVEFLMNGVK